MYQFIELSNKIASENMPGAKVIYFIRIFKCVRSVPKLPICIFYRCLPESNLKTIPSLNMNIFIYLFLNEKKLNSSSGYFEKKKKMFNLTSQWEVNEKQSKHILGTIYIKSQVGFLKTSMDQ